MRNRCNYFFGTLRGREHWEYFGVNKRILLKWFLKKQGWELWNRFIWAGIWGKFRALVYKIMKFGSHKI
jgi:hypothetical protein